MYSPQQLLDPEKNNVYIWSAHNLKEVRNKKVFLFGLLVRCVGFDCWGSVGMLRWCGQCFWFFLIETHGPALNTICTDGGHLVPAN
jgi:hypothetical protein